MCLFESSAKVGDYGGGRSCVRPEGERGPAMAMSDESLLSQIAHGDRDAFSAFYDRHAARIMGLLGKMLARRAEAEDALQETFWQVWSRARDYSPIRSSPIVWLVIIARSRATDILRRRKRDTRGLASEHDHAEPEMDRLERDDRNRQTRQALARLAEEQRSLISMAFYAGMTHEQIAVARGMPLGTVKTRIRSGIRRMRELLDADSKAVAS